MSLLCAPATFSSKTSTASTGMARPISTMSECKARICAGRNWCCRPSLSITSPTTQVNNSWRMVAKSSSLEFESFMIFAIRYFSSFKERFAWASIPASDLLVQRDSQARIIGQSNRAVPDDRRRDALHQVIPERHVRGVEFKHQKIWDRGAEMCGRQSPDGAADVVGSHGDGLRVGKLRNLLGDSQASYLLQARGRDPHGVRAQDFMKSFEAIQVLAGGHRNFHSGTHDPSGFEA